MNTTLVVTGAILAAAAIVGKGLEGAGIKVPALDKSWKRVCLGLLGAAVLAVGVFPQASTPNASSPQPVGGEATSTAPARSQQSVTPSPILDALSPTPAPTAGVHWASLFGLPNDGAKLGFEVKAQKVAGQSYPRTLSQPSACPSYDSPQAITFQLFGKFKQLKMEVGISDLIPSGRVPPLPGTGKTFTVKVDGKDAGDSVTVLGGVTPATMIIDVPGASQVTLLATKGGPGECTVTDKANPLVEPVWINPIVSF